VDPQFGVPADPQAFRRRFGLASPYLLNVANIEPRKNQRLLASVAAELHVELVLVGHVRDADYLAACLAAGGRWVRHVGPLDHHDPLLRSAYRGCEVFVLPSLLETPGLAALEAAAQGARVVVTAEGSTREYFAGLVEYVDPASAASLRAAIERQRQAADGSALRAHVLDQFTWNHAGRSLADAYERTLLATTSVC
jgi:glycosyltransferase involved in cell wall biosynthesis